MRFFGKNSAKKQVVLYGMDGDGHEAIFDTLLQVPSLSVRRVTTLNRHKVIPAVLSGGEIDPSISTAHDILQKDIKGRTPITFITLVPDPFLRHARMTFDYIRKSAGNMRAIKDIVSDERLSCEYFCNMPVSHTAQWFENEFLPATGINILEHPFAVGAVYQTHDIGIHKLIIIKQQANDNGIYKTISDALAVDLTNIKFNPPALLQYQELFMSHLMKPSVVKKIWQSPFFAGQNAVEDETKPKRVMAVNDDKVTQPKHDSRMVDTQALVNACIKGRNFVQGTVFLDAQEILSDKDRRLRIQCNANLNLFERVIADFEMLEERSRLQPAMQIHYLRALANLGRMDVLSRYIQTVCLDMRHNAQANDFLLQAYPFAVYAGNDLAALVRSKLMSCHKQFTKQNINALVRLAHDFVNCGQYQDAYTLAAFIDGLEINTVNRCKLDILSAQNAFTHGRYDLQVEALNRVFITQKAEPIHCDDTSQPIKFNNISCPSVEARSVYGPLVSVIVPAWNCAETLGYAVRSLMVQSYAHLEILIVDDASTDDTYAVAQGLAQMDTRITVIRQPRNMGSYVARNAALAVAKGVFVTCQDADDWAHPQKIERNVAPLLGNAPQLVSAVQHVRYDPERGFRGLGGYIRFDASSMMMRRAEVVERVGFYDCVRVGGDSEYQLRIERQFGPGVFKQLPDMLSLVLWSETSLSGGGRFAIDDDAGIFSPFRNAYRHAFTKWHEVAGNLYMPYPADKRLFDVPEEGLP